MDNYAYLNSISAPAPVPPKKSFGAPSMKTLKKFLLGATILFVLIIAFSLLANRGDGSAALLARLSLRVEHLSEIISDYQPSLKSPVLRGHSSSLSSVLTSVTKGLEARSVAKPSSALSSEEESEASALSDTLEKAKLNGYLDRVYAREFALHITLLINLLDTLLASADTKSDVDFYTNSRDSLNLLLPSFESYSDTAK